MAKKSKAGRPTIMTPEVIGKLETAFKAGLTDKRACLHAGINPDTLYEYCKKNPKFAEKKELLKEDTIGRAQLVVRLAILNNDVNTAKWYLERKCKDEYSPKSVIEPVAPIIKYVTKEEEQETIQHIESVIGAIPNMNDKND